MAMRLACAKSGGALFVVDGAERLLEQRVDLRVGVAAGIGRAPCLCPCSASPISGLSCADISPVSEIQPASQKPNSRRVRLAKNWLAVMASTETLRPTRVSICATAWAICASLT